MSFFRRKGWASPRAVHPSSQAVSFFLDLPLNRSGHRCGSAYYYRSPSFAGIATGDEEKRSYLPKKIPCILNPIAGQNGQPDRDNLAQLFARCGRDVDICFTGPALPADELARRALADNCPLIVVGGGDGTINAIANVIAGTSTAMAILPCGTFNHLAKDLKIPLDLEPAVQAAFSGRFATIDVGEVNGKVFVNNSSIGLYPLMVTERDRERKLGANRWWALAKATALLTRRYPIMEVTLEAGGAVTRRAAPLVFVANNRYEVQSFILKSRERLDEGRLFVYLPQRPGRLNLLKAMMAGMFAGDAMQGEMDVFAIRQFRILTRRRRVHVSTDGEVTLMSTPLNYRIREKALRIAVPAAETEGGK
ncbi:MAG TPA: diacylglycerol kinase family protein [Terriglobales bacterium]